MPERLTPNMGNEYVPPDPAAIRAVARLLVDRILRIESLREHKAPEVILKNEEELLRQSKAQLASMLPPNEREESRAMERAFREVVLDASFKNARILLMEKFLETLKAKISPKEKRNTLEDQMFADIESWTESNIPRRLDLLKQRLAISEPEFEALVKQGQSEASNQNDFDRFADFLQWVYLGAEEEKQ